MGGGCGIRTGCKAPSVVIGLHDRNSPTCTLSQNGYGDNEEVKTSYMREFDSPLSFRPCVSLWHEPRGKRPDGEQGMRRETRRSACLEISSARDSCWKRGAGMSWRLWEWATSSQSLTNLEPFAHPAILHCPLLNRFLTSQSLPSRRRGSRSAAPQGQTKKRPNQSPARGLWFPPLLILRRPRVPTGPLTIAP